MTEIFEERLERAASEAQALTDAVRGSSGDARRNTRVDLEELALTARERDLEDVFVKGLIDTIVKMKITSPNVVNRFLGEGE